jgi:hypothetical protein
MTSQFRKEKMGECKTCQIKNLNKFAESELKKYNEKGQKMPISIDQFIKETIGTFIDYDGVYGNQCVDLIKDYVDKVFGLNPWKSNACDYPQSYPQDQYELIEITPDAVPEKGDIVLFSNEVGPFGHVSIALGNGDVNKFESLDQNWPLGSPVQITKHDYNGVIGWLRRKDAPVDQSSIPTPSPEMPTETAGEREPIKSREYRVQSGDSLWRIAKKFYGRGSQWQKIYEANRDEIDNPSLIYPDQILYIPE